MKDGIVHVYEILQFYKLSHITSTPTATKNVRYIKRRQQNTKKENKDLSLALKKNKSKKPNIKLPREAVAC